MAKEGLTVRALRGAGELLVTFCVLILLFVVYQLWWTDVTAQRSTDEARQELLLEFGMDPEGP